MRTVIRKNQVHSFGSGFITDYGWGNGYVILDEGHPWQDLGYDDIDVDIHGGLTYSETISDNHIEGWGKDFLTKDDIGKYIIGFDTCHYGDTFERWTEEAVQSEADRLLLQCINAVNNKIRYMK